MFNLQGSEMVFLVLIALLVLGPEKLPDAIRKFGRVYGEFRKMANGFQGEIRSALDEPMREIQKTADMMRSAADFEAAPSRQPTKPVAPAAPAASPAPGTSASTPSTSAAPLTETTPEAVAPARQGLNFGNPAARRPVEPTAAVEPSPDAAIADPAAPTEGSPT